MQGDAEFVNGVNGIWMIITKCSSPEVDAILKHLSGCLGIAQFTQVHRKIMEGTLALEVIITKYSPPAGEGVDVELPGLFEHAHSVM